MEKIIMIQIGDEKIYEQIMELMQEYDCQVEMVRQEMEVGVLSYPGLRIERYGFRVYLKEAEVKLSAYEFKLLYHLASFPGRVFTKEQLYQHLYNNKDGGYVENSIYCLIRNLRKKLKDDSTAPRCIRTIKGVGV